LKTEEYNEVRETKLTQIGIELENIVEKYDVSYMDAVIMYSDEHDIELELLGEVVKGHQKITNEIRIEAENLNYLEKSNTFSIQEIGNKC